MNPRNERTGGSSRARRRGALGLGLIAAVLVACLCAAHSATAMVPTVPPPNGGGGGGGGGYTPVGPPEPPPPEAQECVNKYFSNQSRCKALWCDYLLWVIPLGCDDFHLAECLIGVKQAYCACLGYGPDCL